MQDNKTIDWWWGEGDEKFFVDGEKFPSSFGTGSEDYIGYAWRLNLHMYILIVHMLCRMQSHWMETETLLCCVFIYVMQFLFKISLKVFWKNIMITDGQ